MPQMFTLTGLLVLLSMMPTPNSVEASFAFGTDGKRLICVPEYDVPAYNRATTRSSLSFVSGPSPQELVSFQFNAPEIKRFIPNFSFNEKFSDGDPPNTIFGNLLLINKRYTHTPLGLAAGEDVEKIWDHSAPCMKPILKKIQYSPMYLVKCNNDSFWDILFDRSPVELSKSINIYDTVLAECIKASANVGPYASQQFENCTRRILFKNYRVDYQFQVLNSGVIPAMDTFIRSKISSWESNCERKR